MNFELDTTASFFSVPKCAVKHILEADETALRVLLCLLSGEAKSEKELCAKLALSEKKCRGSVDFWYQRGVFVLSAGFVRPAVVAERQAQKPQRALRPPEYTMEEISFAAKKNEDLAGLLRLSQQRLGKLLNPSETRLLYSFCEYYGIEPAAVLTLIDYHVSCGKGSLRQIERTVAHLDECGISTLEEVTAYIEQQRLKNAFEGKVRRLFGLGARALTLKEKKIVDAWQNRLGVGEELLSLAYEKTVDATGKASIPYADRILTRWHEEGKTTPDSVKDEQKPAKTRKIGVESGIDAGEYEKWSIDQLASSSDEE